MAFPEIDPQTLAQAIRTYITARMNVSAVQGGNSANYNEVLLGWAEAIAAAQNPSNAYFEENDQVLFGLLQQQGGNSGSLLFTAGVPLTIGQWVYQVSSDTVALADYSSLATGPAVGVVVGNPTQNTVLVQNLGSVLYTVQQAFGFLPLTPDVPYYIGAAGNITTSPNPPGGGYTQEIGYAKNTLQFVLNLQELTAV